MLFLECGSRPFLVSKNFNMKIQKKTPPSRVLAAILFLTEKVAKQAFFSKFGRVNYQSIINLWICKFKMKIYLKIKNGLFSVWSIKSVDLQNVHAIKISRKYHHLWLAENQYRQLSNVPVFNWTITSMTSIFGKIYVPNLDIFF